MALQPKLSELANGQSFSGKYAYSYISHKTHNTKKGDRTAFKGTISDASASVEVAMWVDAGKESDHPALTKADCISFTDAVFSTGRANGKGGFYPAAVEINENRYQESSFTPAEHIAQLQRSPIPIEVLEARMEFCVSQIKSPKIQGFVRRYMNNPEIWNEYKLVPAASNNHHAYVHGLFEHTIQLMEQALSDKKLATMQPQYNMNWDIVLAGVFFHDSGKIKEQSWKSKNYTDEGKLDGHINLGIEMFLEEFGFAAVREDMDLQHIKRIIRSHHGKPEWGSDKAPPTMEALYIHRIDALSTALIKYQTAIEKMKDMPIGSTARIDEDGVKTDIWKIK